MSADSLALSDTDSLILVDDQDRQIGCLDRAACHRGGGVLHRAFSVLIFNDQGELLLQQRSRNKRLWPLFWSNSCCSHPRPGEATAAAARRRVREELGLECELSFLFKFRYQARYDDQAAENELCSVFVGRSSEPVVADTAELAAWRWVEPRKLQLELAESGPTCFTPWFRLEWERICRDHSGEVFTQTGARSWAYP